MSPLLLTAFDNPTKPLCYLHGKSSIVGIYRVEAEDFQVSEILGFELSNEGPHHWLYIAKKNLNTMDVVQALAQTLSLSTRDIGYAGLKDKKAVTYQWFSVSSEQIKPQVLQKLFDEHGGEIDSIESGWAIQAAKRHHKKLKIGSHKANAFVLRLGIEDVATVDNSDKILQHSAISEGISKRLDKISQQGFLNYFMDQRFGRDNLSQFYHKKSLLLKRKSDQMLLSAARSFIFNHILSQNVASRSLFKPRLGDRCQLVGSQSFFVVDEKNDENMDIVSIENRLLAFDISLAFPLPGQDIASLLVSDLADELLSQMLGKIGRFAKKSNYRAGVCRPHDMSWDISEASAFDISHGFGNAVTIRFTLPKGCYATALLRELGAFREDSEKDRKN
jgi:tRNA pseudouridine13 synthase